MKRTTVVFNVCDWGSGNVGVKKSSYRIPMFRVSLEVSFQSSWTKKPQYGMTCSSPFGQPHRPFLFQPKSPSAKALPVAPRLAALCGISVV